MKTLIAPLTPFFGSLQPLRYRSLAEECWRVEPRNLIFARVQGVVNPPPPPPSHFPHEMLALKTVGSSPVHMSATQVAGRTDPNNIISPLCESVNLKLQLQLSREQENQKAHLETKFGPSSRQPNQTMIFPYTEHRMLGMP